MTRNEPGLLRTSLRFVKQALNENALLRTSVLATALCVTLACIALAAFGVTYTLNPKDGPQTYSPRLFGLLYLPAEFLIYDLILGNSKPRAALKDLYLDWRLLQFFWAGIKAFLAVALPLGGAMLLLVALTAGLGKGAKLSWPLGLALAAAILVLACAMFYLLLRFFYLSIVVARRDDKPVRTAFRETKGRLWRVGCALALPYLAIIAVAVPVELLGPVLERKLGFVGLAPWFLLDAGLSGFMSCLGAAVLAISYQRVIVPGNLERAQAAASAEAAPPDGGFGETGRTGGTGSE